MTEVSAPAFSRDGKYLYVASSTNFGNSTVGLDMSTQDRPVRSGLYAFVLAADGNTPLPPQSDEEEAKKDDEERSSKDAAKGAKKEDDKKEGKKTEPTRIDLEELAGRMVALPVAEKNYGNLRVAEDGSLFYLDQEQAGASREAPGSEAEAIHVLKKFDFKERKEETFLEEVASFEIGAGGTKLLVRGPKQAWTVIETTKKPTGRGDAVATSGLRVQVDPRAEWAHIFHDAWRMEKEYFYAENMHGLDWRAVEKKYAPLVQQIGRREDLNALIIDMIAELQVGHNRISGGDVHRADAAPVGLLGADYEIVKGRYRIRRLLKVAAWNPFDSAPLAVPGLGVKEGDYVLAVDGRELSGDDNIFSLFEGTAGKQVRLTVGSSPDPKEGHDITVVPIANDQSLRLWTWIEDNRRKVSEATGGRVGYIYLPNTGDAGFTYFNRFFFSQVDKEALVIDERFNGGGQAANYITETLGRPWLSGWKDRDGLIFTTPAGVVTGPKVMLINESSGSGGDYLPWSFRYVGLGPLIGTRTWGGLIGISANPRLIDGGNLTVPYFRFFDPEGRWSIENEGVPPDIEVEQTPKEVIAGRDPQLERGITEVLERLKAYKPVIPKTAPPLPTQLGK
jgi:tricorn protease